MNNGIDNQAQLIRQSFGEEAANRYLVSMYQQRDMEAPINTHRWVSNTEHQPKRHTDLEAAVIALEKDAGGTCRQLAQRWGCSQGTVSAIARQKGAYKRKPSTFDY